MAVNKARFQRQISTLLFNICTPLRPLLWLNFAIKRSAFTARTPLFTSAVKFTWHKNHYALPSRATFQLGVTFQQVIPSAQYKRDTRILHYKSPTFINFTAIVQLPHCFGMLSMPITTHSHEQPIK